MIVPHKFSMTSSIEFITPDEAREIMLGNTQNRKFRQAHCDALVNAMRRGEWVLTHQGVAISTSGILFDGQHRLQAIINTGMPQFMLVSRNVPDEAAIFYGIDVGAKRSTADQLGENARDTEVARLFARIIHGSSPSAQQVSQILECGVRDAHHVLTGHYATSIRSFTATPVRAAATLLILNGKDKNYICTTYENMATQNYTGLNEGPACFVRQVNTRIADTGRVGDTFARALKALDPSLRHNKRLIINDGDVEAANELVRTTIKNCTEQIKRAA